jgi:GcrA cell cycle regulator
MTKSSTWTEDRITLLKQFWGQKSAAEIAKILGCGLSRNAVIGKAHRLNLSAGKKPANTSIASLRDRSRNTEARPPRTLRAPKMAVRLPPEPVGAGISLLELTEKTCRYPHGDPKAAEFKFCGAPSLPGLPYCPYHSAVAYQITAKREIAEPVERERPEEEESDLNEIVRA